MKVPLPWSEVSYRAGLLLGAAIFFTDSLGAPWQRGVFGLAALVPAFLFALTLGGVAAVLGDWRDKSRLGLILGFGLVFGIPAAATLTPELGSSVLPDPVERPLIEFLASLRAIPGVKYVQRLVGALISLLILLTLLGALLHAGRTGSRGALALCAASILGPALAFNPSVEALMGLLFLGLFAGVSWDPVLLLPPHLDAELSAGQRDFLLSLRRPSRCTAAEARLLAGGPEELARLEEHGLVAREASGMVAAGPRLLEGPVSTRLGRIVGWLRRSAWFLFGLLYFLFPDLIPGPVDDLLVMALSVLGGLISRRGTSSLAPPPPGTSLRGPSA